jgi:hypothetical protein
VQGVPRTTALIGGALAIAAFIRLVTPVAADFPLNDGALFYQMAAELAANDFRLPEYTRYNQEGIPYAYSPLGFYLAALVPVLLPVELIDVFRVLPAVVSVLCVVAFYLLARDLVSSRAIVTAAVVTFAVLPRSFLWLIMGGGLTRSLGFLFAILTLWQLHRSYTRRAWRHVALTTVFASLTVLSHLGTSPFVAFSAILFFAFYGRHRFGLGATAVVGIGTIVLTAPWWATIAATHGLAPFVAAGATGGTVFSRSARGLVLGKLAYLGLGTAEPLFPLIGALAIIGGLASFTRRGAFLPIWWLAIILLDARAGATYASIPVALLAATAIIDVIVPNVALGASWCRAVPDVARESGWAALGIAPPRRRWLVGVVLAVFAGYGIASALVRRPYAEGRYLTSLTRHDREAMAWAARATPPSSSFIIVVGGAAGGWWADRVGEWFPVLANRKSVATVQGTEWLPGGTFRERERQYDQLQGCAIWQGACVERWSSQHRRSYTHVYIPKTRAFPCCAPLDAALRRDAGFDLVFDGSGASIYQRRALFVE